MVVTTTQIWQRLTEKAITLHPNMVLLCVTINSIRGGIVLWEMLEQKCQQRVWRHTSVVQTSQAGWKMASSIRWWEMVLFPGKSALVIVLLVAKTGKKLMWKTVDPIIFIIWLHHHFVLCATVGLIKRWA